MEKVEKFLKWAKQNGWEVLKRKDDTFNLPTELLNRYQKMPNEFIEFLGLVEICNAPDEKSWFICQDDYNGTSDSAFSWDEMEKMCLVEGNDSYNEPITRFWDTHLPIALSVRNDYAYFALDLGDDYGAVVYSYEPEFEEPERIASSFSEFLDLIMTNKLNFLE